MHILFFLVAMYWLPTIVAVIRRSPSAAGVAVLNFFLGWTVIGWIIALVWALAAAQPHIIVHVDAAGHTTVSGGR